MAAAAPDDAKGVVVVDEVVPPKAAPAVRRLKFPALIISATPLIRDPSLGRVIVEEEEEEEEVVVETWASDDEEEETAEGAEDTVVEDDVETGVLGSRTSMVSVPSRSPATTLRGTGAAEVRVEEVDEIEETTAFEVRTVKEEIIGC